MIQSLNPSSFACSYMVAYVRQKEEIEIMNIYAPITTREDQEREELCNCCNKDVAAAIDAIIKSIITMGHFILK